MAVGCTHPASPMLFGVSPGGFGGCLHQEASGCGTISSCCSGGDPKCFGSRDAQRRGCSCPGPLWGAGSGCSSRSPRVGRAARLGRCQLLSELGQAGKTPYGQKILPSLSGVVLALLGCSAGQSGSQECSGDSRDPWITAQSTQGHSQVRVGGPSNREEHLSLDPFSALHLLCPPLLVAHGPGSTRHPWPPGLTQCQLWTAAAVGDGSRAALTWAQCLPERFQVEIWVAAPPM